MNSLLEGRTTNRNVSFTHRLLDAGVEYAAERESTFSQVVRIALAKYLSEYDSRSERKESANAQTV